jgi:putative phosphoesterase
VKPTRLLVISDIHCNIDALERVIEDAGLFDAAICAGDILGYGPDPLECVDAMISLGVNCVAGNHDLAAYSGDSSRLNAYAQAAITIQRQLLKQTQIAWLGRLPASLALEFGGVGVSVFHGSPRSPSYEYIYPEDAKLRAEELLEFAETDLLILGHTHIPYLIRSGERLLINPGSVGQPRDGDPKASYALLDLDEGHVEVTHRRVEYNIDGVADRMRRRGIPEFLAARLYMGL